MRRVRKNVGRDVRLHAKFRKRGKSLDANSVSFRHLTHVVVEVRHKYMGFGEQVNGAESFPFKMDERAKEEKVKSTKLIVLDKKPCDNMQELMKLKEKVEQSVEEIKMTVTGQENGEAEHMKKEASIENKTRSEIPEEGEIQKQKLPITIKKVEVKSEENLGGQSASKLTVGNNVDLRSSQFTHDFKIMNSNIIVMNGPMDSGIDRLAIPEGMPMRFSHTESDVIKSGIAKSQRKKNNNESF